MCLSALKIMETNYIQETFKPKFSFENLILPSVFCAIIGFMIYCGVASAKNRALFSFNESIFFGALFISCSGFLVYFLVKKKEQKTQFPIFVFVLTITIATGLIGVAMFVGLLFHYN